MKKKVQSKVVEEADAPEDSTSEDVIEKKPFEKYFDLLFKDPERTDEEPFKKYISEELKRIISSYECSKSYRVVFLYDDYDSIGDEHANRVYEAILKGENQNILLILQSRGGRVEPAYLISKSCKNLKKEKFVVAIPRRAKSAATLVSLGADEVHMGVMSELGPIDPQLGGVPALALSNALEKLAELVCKHPGSSEMFASYLKDELSLRYLGYFERINDSATQYAARLLSGRALAEGMTPESVADHLVNHYKDHSFVIDTEEATSLLGGDMVRSNTDEYSLSSELHGWLRVVSNSMRVVRGKYFSYVGSVEEGFRWENIPEKDEA